MPDTEPEILTAPPIRYEPNEARIAELRAEYSTVPDCSTPAGYNEARQAIAVLTKHRSAVEAKRVELKRDALEYGRRVDAQRREAAERIEARAREREEAAAAQERKNAAEREALEAERRKVEQARLDQENREREAREKVERERIAVEAAERARIDAEAQAAERAEEERQEAERAAEAARVEAERLEALRPDAEKVRIYGARILRLTDDPPQVRAPEAVAIVNETLEKLGGIASRALDFGKVPKKPARRARADTGGLLT